MKTSLRLLSIITCLLFSLPSIAQDCEFEYNEVDKFTKVQKLKTKATTIAEGAKIPKTLKIAKAKWSIQKEGDRLSLFTEYHISMGAIVIQQGNHLICLLADEEVIKLPLIPTQNHIPNVMRRKASGMSIFGYEYAISEDQLQQLQSTDVKSVRVEAVMNGIDFDVSEEVSTQKLFSCVKEAE